MSGLELDIKRLVQKSIAENMPVEEEEKHKSSLVSKYVDKYLKRFDTSNHIVKYMAVRTASLTAIHFIMGVRTYMEYSTKVVNTAGNIYDFVKSMPKSATDFLKKFESTPEINDSLAKEYDEFKKFVTSYYTSVTNSQEKFLGLIITKMDEFAFQRNANAFLDICNQTNLVAEQYQDECKNELAAFRKLFAAKYPDKMSLVYDSHNVNRLFELNLVPNKSTYYQARWWNPFKRHEDVANASFFNNKDFPYNWFDKYQLPSTIPEQPEQSSWWDQTKENLIPYITPFTDYKTLLALGALGATAYYGPSVAKKIGSAAKSGYNSVATFMSDTFNNIKERFTNTQDRVEPDIESQLQNSTDLNPLTHSVNVTEEQEDQEEESMFARNLKNASDYSTSLNQLSRSDYPAFREYTMDELPLPDGLRKRRD